MGRHKYKPTMNQRLIRLISLIIIPLATLQATLIRKEK